MRAVLIALALAGCKRTVEVRGPPAIIELAGSVWSAEREGDAPMIRGPEGLFVYASTARFGDRMPGLSIGSSRGPELSLLAGEFAPLLVPDRSEIPRQLRIEAAGSTLAIDFAGAFSARVHPPHRGWVRLVVDGAASVVAPSGRTTISGFRGEQPAFSEEVTAWSEASLEPRAVDRIQIQTERRGTIVIASSCVPRMMRPRARANTSSFLVRLGPPRNDFDPLYAPEDATDSVPQCAGTATISVRAP